MLPPDTYFLTEAVQLYTKGPLAGEDNEVAREANEYFGEVVIDPTKSSIIPTLILYGINLNYNDPAYPHLGTFNPDRYFDWIESRRLACPPALGQIIMKCLEEEPSNRYSSVEDLYIAILDYEKSIDRKIAYDEPKD